MATIEIDSSTAYTFNINMEELDSLIKDLQELQAQMRLTRADCLLSSFALDKGTDLIFRVLKSD